jgi:hypothetical protein
VIGSDAQPFLKFGVVLNLMQRTGTGFHPMAHIDSLDDVNVVFNGDTGTPFGGTSSVHGSIDRVTGAASVYTATYVKDGKVVAAQKYELVCNVTNRLF